MTGHWKTPRVDRDAGFTHVMVISIYGYCSSIAKGKSCD